MTSERAGIDRAVSLMLLGSAFQAIGPATGKGLTAELRATVAWNDELQCC